MNRRGLPCPDYCSKVSFAISGNYDDSSDVYSKTRDIMLNVFIDRTVSVLGSYGKMEVANFTEVELNDSLFIDTSTVMPETPNGKSSLISTEFSDIGDIYYSTYHRKFVNIFGEITGEVTKIIDGKETTVVLDIPDILNELQYSQLSEDAKTRIKFMYELSAAQYDLISKAHTDELKSGMAHIRLGNAGAAVLLYNNTNKTSGTVTYYPKDPRIARNRVREPYTSGRWDLTNHFLVFEDRAVDCYHDQTYIIDAQVSDPESTILAFSRGLLIRKDKADSAKVGDEYQGAYTDFFLTQNDPYPTDIVGD